MILYSAWLMQKMTQNTSSAPFCPVINWTYTVEIPDGWVQSGIWHMNLLINPNHSRLLQHMYILKGSLTKEGFCYSGWDIEGSAFHTRFRTCPPTPLLLKQFNMDSFRGQWWRLSVHFATVNLWVVYHLNPSCAGNVACLSDGVVNMPCNPCMSQWVKLFHLLTS